MNVSPTLLDGASEQTRFFVEPLLARIEAELVRVLALEPDARTACTLITGNGQAPRVEQTMNEHAFASYPVPKEGTTEHLVWQGWRAALEQPAPAGVEWLVWVHLSPEDGKVRHTVMQVAVRTDARAVVQQLLPRSTPDELAVSMAATAVNRQEFFWASLTCAEIAGAAKSLAESFADKLEPLSFLVKEAGKNIRRWWASGKRDHRMRELRQRLILTLLLTNDRHAEAIWLHGLADTLHKLIFPPQGTPGNAEVLSMSFAVWLAAEHRDGGPEDLQEKQALRAHLAEAVHGPLTAGLVEQDADGGNYREDPELTSFLMLWRAAAFARLEVSHKLAAALCLTDVPTSTDVRAPWTAWSLLVPNGLFGDVQPARLWCVDTVPVFVVDSHGIVVRCDAGTAGSSATLALIEAFVRAVCVVLSDPDRIKSQGRWGTGPSNGKVNRRPAASLPEGARYVLAQPVTIDLRETVREAVTGARGGGIPKHQFLVRGHPRQQAWGPQHSLRRYKWIEPYWKGDPEARILLRGHRVQDD